MPQNENKLGLRKLVLGQLQTNCYLVFNQRGRETIIIDPANDADYIMRILADLELKPLKIIATHGHYDHILGVTELKLAYDIPFLMHKKDEFLLSRMESSVLHFSGLKSGPAPKVDQYLKKGDSIKLGQSFLKVLETPGHTPGSISLYNKEECIVFVGDVIFAGGGVGRTDFRYSSQKDLKNSIKNLLKLPKGTVVHAGHGGETTIGAFL